MKRLYNRRIISILLSIVIILTVLPLYSYAAITMPAGFTLVSDKETVLAPGIVQNKSVLYKPDGKRVEICTATADTSVDTVSFEVNYKDNQFSKYGMQKLSQQVAAAERNHDEPYTVIAAINASHYNMETGVPEGCFIMDGNVINDYGGHAFFAILNDGTPIIRYGREYKNYKGNIRQAASGSLILIENGRINSNDGQTVDYGGYNVINPRTTVGITADNKVIYTVTDGRNEPVSAGMTAYEQAQVMLELGCVWAMNFDGGGSTTYGSKEPGKDFKICNTPSDGSERSISASFMMVSTAQPTGEFDHAFLDCDYRFLTCGTSLQINAVGVDVTENVAPLPDSGLTWTLSDNSMGSITGDGVFTAADDCEGEVTVYLNYNGRQIGSLPLTVTVPDTIKFTTKKINVQYSERVPLPISGYADGIPVAINENDFIAVHEYEYNGSVHDSLLDNYGYFDGMYFVTPAEEMGVKTETLYMVPIFADDESLICTLKLEFHKEGDEYFDFENATVKTDKMSWFRTVTNSETIDDYNYTRLDNSAPMTLKYRFGLAMDEMDLPEELQSMWDAFGDAMGDNIWDAFLRLAKKIDSSTYVAIDVGIDPNFEFVDYSSVRLITDLFTLDPNEITYDPDTNSMRLIVRWNQDYINEAYESEEGLTPDTVNATVIFDDVYFRLKDSADLSAASGLNITNSFSIAYSFIAISASAYGIALSDPQLERFAYDDGSRKGICFSTTYLETQDKFRLFEGEDAPEGWQGSSYYENGEAVTGINYLPSQTGDDSYYYEFDENGICLGKYTGIVEKGDNLYYSEDGKPAFAGLVMTDGGNFYYFGENLAAANGRSVYVKKTNGLCDEGTYNLLGDKRVILAQNEEVLLYTNYAEALDDGSVISAPQGSAAVTTGTQLVCYRNGILTTKTVAKFGDVDSDAICDGRDSVMILCIINGMLSSDNLSAAQLRAADCDKDGTITENDFNLCCSSGLLMQEISQNPPVN